MSLGGRQSNEGNPILKTAAKHFTKCLRERARSLLFNPFTGAFNTIYSPSVAAQGAATPRGAAKQSW